MQSFTESDLINIKSARRSSSRLGFTLFATIVMFYAVIHGVSFLLKRIPDFNYDGTILIYIVNYVPIYGFGLLLVFLCTRKIPAAAVTKKSFSPRRLIAVLLMGYAFGFFTNLAGNFINGLLSSSFNSAVEITDMVSTNRLISFIVMVIIAPVVEELIFRKFLIDRLHMFSMKFAIIFSAVAFGLYHRNLQQILYATVIGLFLGYTYAESGKIHYTMIMHAVINGLGFLNSIIAGPLIERADNLDLFALESDEMMIVVLSVIGTMTMLIITIGLVITGTVFFFIWGIKVRFTRDAASQLPEGSEFKAFFLNPGEIAYAVLCLALMVLILIGIL